jgi:hypothetical protein
VVVAAVVGARGADRELMVKASLAIEWGADGTVSAWIDYEFASIQNKPANFHYIVSNMER